MKMLVTIIFSFSPHVFKRLLSQGRQRSGFCSKGFRGCIPWRKTRSPNWYAQNIVERLIYWTKVKTLHIYSSSKIAFILFFRHTIKSHTKISFFGFHLLETHIQQKWLLDVMHFISQKRNWNWSFCTKRLLPRTIFLFDGPETGSWNACRLKPLFEIIYGGRVHRFFAPKNPGNVPMGEARGEIFARPYKGVIVIVRLNDPIIGGPRICFEKKNQRTESREKRT